MAPGLYLHPLGADTQCMTTHLVCQDCAESYSPSALQRYPFDDGRTTCTDCGVTGYGKRQEVLTGGRATVALPPPDEPGAPVSTVPRNTEE